MSVSSVRCGLGEGPLWHPVNQQLYVTDIFAGEVLRLDAELRPIDTLRLGRPTTAMTWQSDGSMLFFHDAGVISRVGPDGTIRPLPVRAPEQEPGLFNDVIADGAGRVLAGVKPVGDRPGRLFRIGPGLAWEMLQDRVQEPNGLGFSPDGRMLYFSDSAARTIWRFPYDVSTGALGAREMFFRQSGEALPDGLTVDAEGFVWSALWNGAAVLRIDPAGRIERRIELPARRITSVAFGGADFSTLYVTSARDHAPDPSQVSELDGAIFALHGCGSGRAELPSRIGC
jgi:D-xylonolactonase